MSRSGVFPERAHGVDAHGALQDCAPLLRASTVSVTRGLLQVKSARSSRDVIYFYYTENKKKTGTKRSVMYFWLHFKIGAVFFLLLYILDVLKVFSLFSTRGRRGRLQEFLCSFCIEQKLMAIRTYIVCVNNDCNMICVMPLRKIELLGICGSTARTDSKAGIRCGCFTDELKHANKVKSWVQFSFWGCGRLPCDG